MAIWLCTLCNAVLGELPAAPRLEAPGREVPLSQGQLLEGVEMLTQIGQQTALVLGPTHLGVGDADLAIGLARHLAGDADGAARHVAAAVKGYGEVGNRQSELLAHKALEVVG